MQALNNYTIHIGGRVQEVVIGTSTEAAWKYCQENELDLHDPFSWSDDGVPEDCFPYPTEDWTEHDNILHAYGPVLSETSYLTVTDSSGLQIWNAEITENGSIIQTELSKDIIEVLDETEGQVFYFIGRSFEKGLGFEGEIETEEFFDPSKLKLSCVVVYGDAVLQKVTYADKEIECLDFGTTGQSIELSVEST